MILLALNKGNRIVHIDDVDKGLACGCVCLKCGENLIARKGESRANHFKHHTLFNCEGAQETALHKLGKQILVEHQKVTIPIYGEIDYTDAILEKQVGNFRPDLLVTHKEKSIGFEIFVTHAVNKSKQSEYERKGLNGVEIDLSSLIGKEYKIEEVVDLVLEKVHNKSIIFWDAKEKMDEVENVVDKFPKIDPKEKSVSQIDRKVTNRNDGVYFIFLILTALGLLSLNKKYKWFSLNRKGR